MDTILRQLKEPPQPWKRWEHTILNDDAGGVYLFNDQLLFQSVDIITPVCDDPKIFGEIAVANALNDIYVRGAKPVSALHILSYPPSKIPPSVIAELLNQACNKLAEAGAISLGGHTLKGSDVRYGLAVTGIVQAQDGIPLGLPEGFPETSLFLTKPLGTGVLIEAYKGGTIPLKEYSVALNFMRKLNRHPLMGRGFHALAVTDVTGYGFLIHLSHLVGNLRAQVELNWTTFPIFASAWALWKSGHVTGAGQKNAEFLKTHVPWFRIDELPETVRYALTDPQTSGGLLIALPSDQEQAFLHALTDQGQDVWHIGRIYPSPEPSLTVPSIHSTPHLINDSGTFS